MGITRLNHVTHDNKQILSFIKSYTQKRYEERIWPDSTETNWELSS